MMFDPLDPQDEDLDESPFADLDLPPRVVVRKHRKAFVETVGESKAADAGSWWVGLDRERFKVFAAERTEQLRNSKAAQKVKTMVNFIQ